MCGCGRSRPIVTPYRKSIQFSCCCVFYPSSLQRKVPVTCLRRTSHQTRRRTSRLSLIGEGATPSLVVVGANGWRLRLGPKITEYGVGRYRNDLNVRSLKAGKIWRCQEWSCTLFYHGRVHVY